MNQNAIIRCPTCGKLVGRKDPEFPFCSRRCRTIDLGNWASSRYIVSSPLDPSDEDSVRKIEYEDDSERFR
ncbi:MAG: DNA gyrase inhibitor YacG [Terriglobales bacterium]|jgi:endogenous inhibitor of DNA gyrase (YacG/DUF329 family)